MHKTALLLPFLLVATPLALLTACAQPQAADQATHAPHDGPIVLITIDTLRADRLGSGLTPYLDQLGTESDWAGPAVSASSWTVPSMASLFTGMQPWSHGVWHGERAHLREALTTLPERVKAAGYETLALRSNRWLTPGFGYGQGFDEFYDLGQRKRAKARLRSLDGSKQFVWIHVLPPHAPYEKFAHLSEQVRAATGRPADQTAFDALPKKMRPLELEPFYDPDHPLDEQTLEQALTLYDFNVARSDEMIGGLLEALHDSGQWDNTLLAVTSDHGEEFGENGQVLHGGSLHRALIEVPLLLKLPADMDRPLFMPDRPSNLQLTATLIEAATGAPAWSEAQRASHAPSFFEDADWPALSELYLANGVNEFSIVASGTQTLWRVPFAPPERDYYRARHQGMGGAPEIAPSEEPQQIWTRQRQAWRSQPPVEAAAGEEVEVTVTAWTPQLKVPAPAPLEDIFVARNGWPEAPAIVAPEPSQAIDEADRKALEALGYVTQEAEPEAQEEPPP